MGSIRSFRYSQLGVLLAALVLLGIFAMAVQTVRSFQTTSEALLHTQELRLKLTEAVAPFKEINASVRAYLTSGDEQALAGRQQGMEEFEKGIARLEALTVNHP